MLCGPKSSAFWLALGVPAIFGTSFVLVAFYEATIRLFLRIFLWLAGVTYSVRTRIGEAFDQAQEIASQTALAGSNIAEAVQVRFIGLYYLSYSISIKLSKLLHYFEFPRIFLFLLLLCYNLICSNFLLVCSNFQTSFQQM